MEIRIIVDFSPENADEKDHTGLTSSAYERLSGHTDEHGPGSLSWLGEIQDVTREELIDA